MRAAHRNDDLTGALSRAAFDQQLQAEVSRAEQLGQACGLLFFDIDHFKSINDGFGHARGDAVLIELVKRIRTQTRSADQLFRYGGDEFAVLLPNTARDEATRLAERLLAAARSRPFAGSPPLTITISVGVAAFPSDAPDALALLQRADARNYSAKRRGRACVVSADVADPSAIPVEDGARLIERDAVMSIARQFLADLAMDQRGVLSIVGAAGSGRSRVIAELAASAQLQGYACVAIAGRRTPLAPPYAALITALPELGRLSAAADWRAALIAALHGHMEGAGSDRLLLCVDDLPDLDWGSRDLIRQVLDAAEIPTLGLIVAADPAGLRQAALPAVGRAATAVLEPLSIDGIRAWLRVLLQWEPPAAFIAWLAQQTGGRPGPIAYVLQQLISQGAATREDGGWRLSATYPSIGAAALARWQRAIPPHNLPAALTSFVGRERERAEIRQLLATSRLLTLTGSGGMGKTRLSLEVGADLLETFPDGVWLVELAPIVDPAQVIATIASVLGVREEQGRPLLTTVLDWLRPKQMLLVLDNCEHLLDDCAAFADRALRAAPAVRILASSREPLDIGGEQVYRVPALETPDLQTAASRAQLERCAATRLFLARASAAQAGFQVSVEEVPLIAQICARLDGIPLALELAAARTRTMEIAEIAAGLEDRFQLLTTGNRMALPRHQTLRALIDWSHTLLTDAERILFRRLAIFSGGWTRAAAEAVCGEDARAEHVGGLLAQLVSRSLVQADTRAGEMRYDMLETIRHYARERLVAAHEHEIMADRHLAWVRQRIAAAAPAIIGAGRAPWVAQLARDYRNIQAALEWACLHHAAAARSLAAELGWFWYFSDQLNEGHAWCRRVLALGAPDPLDRERARVLETAGMLASNLGYLDEARPWLEQSIAIGRQNGHVPHAAVFSLGYLLVQLGEDSRACALFESHAADLRIAAPLLGGWSLSYWARALGHTGGSASATRLLHDEAVALGQRHQDSAILATAHMNLGLWAADQGDYHAAAHDHEESLRWRRESGTRLHIAISAHYVADMRCLQRAYDAAQPLYEESLAHSRALGDQAFIAWTAYRLGYLHCHQGDMLAARALLDESLSIYLRQQEQTLITSCLAGWAELHRRQGHAAHAAQLLGYVSAHPQTRQRLYIYAVDQVEYALTLHAVQQQPAKAVQTHWAIGESLTLEAAVAIAREQESDAARPSHSASS